MNLPNPGSPERDDVEFVANAAMARWEVIADALTPVLGRRGVAALYRRTIYVTGRTYPCILQAFETTEPVTFKNLRKVLTQQSVEVATAVADASIENFHELLNNLIGVPLTQTLLGSVWSPFSGSPTQDKQK